jgi:hypothetical protein
MSQVETTTPVNNEVKKQPIVKLTDKYNRYVVLIYKLLNEMKNTDAISEDTYIAMLKGATPLFQDGAAQKEYLEDFFESYKGLKNNMNSELRILNKPVKEKKKNMTGEPPKKRGPKKKEIVDNRSEEEKLIDNLVQAAQSAATEDSTAQSAATEDSTAQSAATDTKDSNNENIDKNEIKDEVECVVAIVDKPKMQRKRKPKKEVVNVDCIEDGCKTPELSDLSQSLETPENVPKPKKTPRAPKKQKKEVTVEVPVEIPKMEELNEEDYSSDEEEIVVRRWSFEGKNYLKDEENNVYDCDTQDVIGKFNSSTNELIPC